MLLICDDTDLARAEESSGALSFCHHKEAGLGKSVTLNATLQRSIKTQMDMDLFNGTPSREANKWLERLVLERSHTAVRLHKIK